MIINEAANIVIKTVVQFSKDALSIFTVIAVASSKIDLGKSVSKNLR